MAQACNPNFFSICSAGTMRVQFWWLGSLSKGLRSCCHEPTVLLGERDVHLTRKLSNHACVVSPPENLTFLCHQDADRSEERRVGKECQ